MSTKWRCKDKREMFFVGPHDEEETLAGLPIGIVAGNIMTVTNVTAATQSEPYTLTIENEWGMVKKIELWAFSAWFEEVK